MEFLGYFGALLTGLSLGMIGGGGSILTVPIFVYLFGLDVVTATGYSLFVVGVASLIGCYKHYRQNQVNIKTAIVFGISSIITVYLTRKYLVPAIPDHLFQLGDFEITKGVGMMVLFALLMIVASYSMIKRPKNMKPVSDSPAAMNYGWILLEGVGVGLLAGMVGAGGGFLIVPALVLLAKLPMKTAVGTSLLIIAVNSLSGFAGELSVSESINWMFLTGFTGLSVLGILIGNYLAKYVPGPKLRPAFGWFVLVMGIFIIIKELFETKIL